MAKSHQHFLQRRIAAAGRRRGAGSPGARKTIHRLLWTMLVLAAGCLVGTQAQGAGQPTISVDPPFLDLGVLEPYQQETREVTLRNTGDAPLHISGVETSCGCTVADLLVDLLQPGEHTVLKISFDSEKFEGPQTKEITIHSDDPANPDLEYQLFADVHVPVLVDPPLKQIGFGVIHHGETPTQIVTFTSEDVPDLQITPKRYNESLFSLEFVHPYEGDPHKVMMAVSTKPDAPVGNHREFIRVATNVDQMPSLDLEAFVNIVQSLSADVEKINFRYVERDEVMEQSVHVRPTEDDIKFEITKAEIDLPNFNVRVEQTIPNQEAVVHLSGRPLATNDPRVQAAQGRMTGTLRIFTNLPSQPELTIKVSYLLKL